MKISKIIKVLGTLPDDDIRIDDLPLLIREEIVEKKMKVFERMVKSTFDVLFDGYQPNTWKVKVEGFRLNIKFHKSPKDVQRFHENIIHDIERLLNKDGEISLLEELKITPLFDKYELTLIVEEK